MGSTDLFISGMLGEYQLERLLGQSQLGAAYLAQQPAQGRRVMVTTFNLPEGMSVQEHEQLSLRLARESEILVRLTHPHILPIYAFGIQPGYLYLVTAFVKEASLAQSMKQNTRFTPQQMLPVLKQLAEGLDYAHSQGMVHGMLSLSNVLVSTELNVRIAGFGLHTILEIHGKAQNAHPLAHLTRGNGTFVGHPEYIAPERVLGLPDDARSDIYGLGVMLFELLSGTRPFRGIDPLDIALLRLQQPVPSIHEVCAEVPEAFDLVLKKMLERDPERRTRSAGEAALTFERIVKTLDPTQWATATSAEQAMLKSQVTLPPTVNWFDEPVTPLEQLQEPPVGTGQIPDIAHASSTLPLVQPGSSTLAGNNSNSLGGTDPFAWWTSTSNGLQAASSSPAPGTFARRPPIRLNNARSRSRKQPAQQDRRKLVTLIVTGVAAAGVVSIGGISFAHFTQSMKQQPQLASGPASLTGSTPTTAPGKTPTSAHPPTPTKVPQRAPTAQPTQAKQPTPTPKPNPTPTPPPSHTGKVIGHTNQPINSAVMFTNPADGQGSLLIHMANGTFVACERACTHQGVPVDYSTGNQNLHCPAHGAVFDPHNGFACISGPGNGPLAKVSIRVNGDGTITTG